MKLLFIGASVLILAASLGAVPAEAAMGDLLKTYNNPDPHPGDWFGSGLVAGVGNNVLFGASGSDHVATDAGAAYLMKRDGTVLDASYGSAAGDQYGCSVAARGIDQLVGALMQGNGGAGAAYLRNGTSPYGPKLTLSNPTPNPSESYGHYVTAMGNNPLVSAVWDNPGGAALCGAVYLHDGVTGALLHTFQPPVIGPRQFYGMSVTAVGSYHVLVGAQTDNTHGFDTGAAYLYTWDGFSWNDATPLKIYEPTPSSYFGRSVAKFGNDYLVSSYSHTYLIDGATGTVKNTFQPNGSVATVGGNVLITPTGGGGSKLYSGVAPYQLLWSSPVAGDVGAALGPDILLGDPSYSGGVGIGRLFEGPANRWIGSVGGSWDTGANWSTGAPPVANDYVLIQPTSTQMITANALPATIGALTIGAQPGGVVQLQTQSNAQLTVTGPFVIDKAATVRMNGLVNSLTETRNAGELQMATGSLLAGGPLTNTGVIAGNGQISGTLVNNAGGEVRIGAGQKIAMTGPFNANTGKIEILGGEAECSLGLTNYLTGKIDARDSILRFGTGLTNQGALNVSFGTTDVFGPIYNSATGKITLSGNSMTTIWDDVTNEGSIKVSAGSLLTIFGKLSGNDPTTGGGTVFLEGGTGSLAAASLILAGNDGGMNDLPANVDNAGNLVVSGDQTLGTLTGGGNTSVVGDGVLNAASISQDSLCIGGAMPVTAVPEPSSFALLSAAGVALLLAWRRRR
jgi:hypothetical protein